MTRLRPYLLLLLGAAGVAAIGYAALRCIAWGWRLGLTEHRILAGTITFWSGAALAFLAFLLVIETRIGFLRARRDWKDAAKDEWHGWRIRCGVCDTEIIARPYAYDRKKKIFTCMTCVKEEERDGAA